MEAFSFIHAADLHIDSPFSGLQEEQERVARLLRDSTFKAFDNLVDAALRSSVDFVLIAGDVYDGQDRSLRAQLRFARGLSRLADAGISSFVVHGNHDPLDGWSTALRWPPKVHIFRDRVEVKPVFIAGQEVARIAGVSFATRDVRENLARGFRNVTGAPFLIGLLHCNVGSDTGHEAYAPCALGDLAESSVDYWALGHVHRRQVLRESSPLVAYPGNIQGRNPRETGEHGAYLVRVDEDRGSQLEFICLDVVRWITESLSVEECETADAVVSAVTDRCLELLRETGDKPALVRIHLTGRTPAHSELWKQESRDPKGFVQTFREAHTLDRDRLWLEDVRVATRPPVDLSVRRSARDFLGQLLRAFEEARTDHASRERLRSALAPLYNHPRARTYLGDPPDGHELEELIAEAESLCADMFMDDEAGLA